MERVVEFELPHRDRSKLADAVRSVNQATGEPPIIVADPKPWAGWPSVLTVEDLLARVP
jgi:hypothetical protein